MALYSDTDVFTAKERSLDMTFLWYSLFEISHNRSWIAVLDMGKNQINHISTMDLRLPSETSFFKWWRSRSKPSRVFMRLSCTYRYEAKSYIPFFSTDHATSTADDIGCFKDCIAVFVFFPLTLQPRIRCHGLYSITVKTNVLRLKTFI